MKFLDSSSSYSRNRCSPTCTHFVFPLQTRQDENKQPGVCFRVFLLTCRSRLGHAVGAVQGQDGVLGQRLLGRVLGFSGAAALTEQVQVCLRRWRAGGSSGGGGLCRSARSVTGTHLGGENRFKIFRQQSCEKTTTTTRLGV